MPNGIDIYQAIASAMANFAGEKEFNELALCIVKGGNVHDCLRKIHNPLNPPKPCTDQYISYVNDLMINSLKVMRDDSLKKLKLIEKTLVKLEKTRKSFRKG